MAPLPDRSEEAEDAFVAQHAGADDVDALVDAISAAMDARRPRLAARLVGLLDGRVEIPPGSALARALAAAQWMLHERPTPAERSWSALEEAWAEARHQRVRRALRRMRAALEGRVERESPFDRDPRRRR